MDVISYALSRKYTNDTVIGLGAIKGSNCSITSIVDNSDGTHDITFSWKDTSDVTHTSVLTVSDGETPTFSSTVITGGHRITFTTEDKTVSFDVMDGSKGDSGISVVSSNVDDNNNLTFTLSNGNVISAGKINAVTIVDTALSTSSSNPVENKVITNALNNKVDKESGKGLSTEDFTTAEKDKLSNIEDNAQVNVIEKLIINGTEATVTDKAVALTLITSAVSNLQNYYLKTETYTKTEIEDLIGSTVGVTIEIVEELPTEGQSNVIYFLPTETTDVYSQYLYTADGWVLIGSTTVDLSNYYTKTQVDTLLAAKQNTLTIDSFPTSLSNNPVASGGVYTAIAQMQSQFQYSNMPTASADNLGYVYQYIGTTGTYTQNMFYRCIYDDTLGEYQWKEVIFNATVTVDSAIDSTSENPVQNKVIKSALDEKQDIIQYSTMPSAQDNLGKIVQYSGTTTSTYTNGYFYKAVYDSENDLYYWKQIEFSEDILIDSALSNSSENPVQNKVITNAITEITDVIPSDASSSNQLVDRDSLGTASQKNVTPYVSPDNADVPISSSVYSAITSAVYGAYHPSGSKTISELTSDLLVLANIGNVYKITEDGVTTNLFIGGEGQTIHTGDNAVVVYGGQPNTFLFDLQSGSIDLTPYQTKELGSAVEGETTVEGALGALSTNKAPKTDITYKNKSLTTTSVDDFGATLVANGVGSYSGTVSVNGTWYNYQSTIQGNLSDSWYGNAILWGDSGDFYTFRKGYSTSTTWIQKKFVTNEIIPSDASANNQLVAENNRGIGKFVATDISTAGWYKICEVGTQNQGVELTINLGSTYTYNRSCAHMINFAYGYNSGNMTEIAKDDSQVFDKIRFVYIDNSNRNIVLVHYNVSNKNGCYATINGSYNSNPLNIYNFESVDESEYTNYIEYDLGTDGAYKNGEKLVTESDLYADETTVTVTSDSSGSGSSPNITLQRSSCPYYVIAAGNNYGSATWLVQPSWSTSQIVKLGGGTTVTCTHVSTASGKPTIQVGIVNQANVSIQFKIKPIR